MNTSEQHDGPNASLLARIDSMQAAMDRQQEKIRALEAHTEQSSARQITPGSMKTPRSSTVRWPWSGRTRRLGVGLTLGLLLLIAPGESAVTHAAYESYSDTAYGISALPMGPGIENSAFGVRALTSDVTGRYNTASGYQALYHNDTGNANTAFGDSALSSNTSGGYNTAVGYAAGYTATPANGNTTGSNNTFIGYNSGPGVATEINNSTAIGVNALVSGSNSIVLGDTGDNTPRVGIGTTTPHSAFQVARGYIQFRSIVGAPPAASCATAADYGRAVARSDGTINLYVCSDTGWHGLTSPVPITR